MPKVSIVLPTYNGEKYLRESIESIINQTFTDWELIIVNDCSTDSTPQLVNEYARKDKRIRVIHNKLNQKLPNSLNIGFREARGDFLTWTSDDNLYLPEAIGKMCDYLNNHIDIYMVCSNMDLIDLDGNKIRPFMSYDEKFMYYNDCVGASFMYRREVLEDIGEYDSTKFLVEDYDYWLRILFRYKKIGHLDETLYLYRTHPGSLTSTRENEIRQQLLKLRKKNFIHLLKYYKNNPKYLCALYYDFKEKNFDISDIEKEFLSYAPVLKEEKDLDPTKQTIVYGAGKFGDKAFELLKDNVKYYADKDKEKVGTYKNGVKIISIDEMANKKSEYNILIAISGINIYDMINILSEKNICSFSVYQSL
ncbi:MAG: glycosyltransferase [Ruminococcaceae bacterium]|nr:glycosyltransferase [Oscillospiraceae bacterium]